MSDQHNETRDSVACLPSEEPLHQRRIKTLLLDWDLLVSALNWCHNPHELISLPVTDELPKDTWVVNVWPDYDRRCLAATICSAEFQPVPPEIKPPIIPGPPMEIRFVSLPVAPKENAQ